MIEIMIICTIQSISPDLKCNLKTFHKNYIEIVLLNLNLRNHLNFHKLFEFKEFFKNLN